MGRCNNRMAMWKRRWLDALVQVLLLLQLMVVPSLLLLLLRSILLVFLLLLLVGLRMLSLRSLLRSLMMLLLAAPLRSYNRLRALPISGACIASSGNIRMLLAGPRLCVGGTQPPRRGTHQPHARVQPTKTHTSKGVLYGSSLGRVAAFQKRDSWRDRSLETKRRLPTKGGDGRVIPDRGLT